ncbi:MAG: hypothetical protein O2815_08750 [Actinomycetota bacterium]|nr:hypothetical protein [Actinomycetota bacterium]
MAEPITDGPPVWTQAASPSPTDDCKIADGLPSELLAEGRGGMWNGMKARGPVGFPWRSANYFPNTGSLNMLAVLVAFSDTSKFVDNPHDYWDPQVRQIEKWSTFWSQGAMTFTFDVVDQWVELPFPSFEAPASDTALAAAIVERLPADIDLGSVDAVFLYWAPGITAGTRSDFGLRVNSIDERERDPNDPTIRQMVWSSDLYHYEDSGLLTVDTKRNSLWTHLVHEILHEMNMNLHGPGNGWATGVGQNHYPTQQSGQSVALVAWEQFLLSWMNDEQVHCITPSDLATTQNVILTPLEVYGGERRVIIVPLSESDVVVVESRRPIGYSATWDPSNSGLLVYTVNPQVPEQVDHVPQDCGNDPTYTKWAYYLFPDQETEDPTTWCGARGGVFYPAIVNVGETVTHNGMRIELVHSTDGEDFVTVTAVD